MKLLAMGDFHGRVPRKFEHLIRKEKVDLVVLNGDFFPFLYRDAWFTYCYRKDVALWQVLGKAKTKRLVLRDIRAGERVLRTLNEFGVPVIMVPGNADHLGKAYNDQYTAQQISPSGWKWYDQNFFASLIRRYTNLRRFDYSFVRFGAYVFIGARGGTSPGDVMSAAFRRHRRKLDVLFKRFTHENVVFVSHNVPYNMKLDKIGMKAHVAVRGKQYGSKLIRRVVDRWQPLVHIGGHIHESSGMQKLGRTICVNTGAAHEGKAAIIELAGKKVRVKFIGKS